MNRKRAFCTFTDLLISIALCALGGVFFLPFLKVILDHGPSVGAMLALGTMAGFPFLLLRLTNWAECQKRFGLHNLFYVWLCLAILPGISCAISALLFLGGFISCFAW